MNGRAVAALEMGETWANLSVYAAGSLFFSRSIPMPPDTPKAYRGEASGQGIAKNSPRVDPDTPPEWLKTILRAVRFSLTFYDNETRRDGIEAVYLAGGCALIPGTVEAFEVALGLPVRILNPLESLTLPSEQTDALIAQGPRFALAMGLARRR
jgi:type IV pilus assembly protein PilM